MSVLDEIADEVFPAEKPTVFSAPAAEKQPAATASVLDEVADEVFEGKPPKEPEPGILSRAASAVTSAVREGVSATPIGRALGFKPTGPTVAEGAAAPPKDVALPQGPTPEALKATGRSASVIPEPVAPPPPVPVKLGPVPGLAAVSAEAQKAPLLERVSGAAPGSPLPVPERPAPGGMLGRAAAKAGIVEPEAAKRRAAEAEFAAASVMTKPEGMDPGWWQVQQDIRQANRALDAMPKEFVNRILFGIPNAIKDTFGFDSPQARAPQSTAEAITGGTGDLAGFIVGPAKVAHGLLAGNITKALAPQAGNALGTIMAKSIANEAATLAVASGLAHAGEVTQADSMKEAFHQLGEHVKGGAILGATFGGLGNVIPANTLMQRAARLGVGLGVLDVVQGTSPGDDRALAQKIYDYGLNTYFLWSGKDPRAIKASLEAAAAARSKPGAEVTPEQVLKSVLDKAMERADKVKTAEPELPGVPVPDRSAELSAILTEELAAATAPLKSAAEVATEKTGGPIAGPSPVAAVPAPEILLAGAARPAPGAKLAGPKPGGNVGIPGRVPTVPSGPVRLLDMTGKPLEIPAEVVDGLESAQDKAAARAQGLSRPKAGKPQAAAGRPAPVEFQGFQERVRGQAPMELWGLTEDIPGTQYVKGSTVGRQTLEGLGYTVPPAPGAAAAPVAATGKLADRPITGLSFKDYVELSGKKWPLTSREPDYARLRFEFDDMKKGLYEARPVGDGRWAVINRKTGEEVDHLPSGAKAQLESNRLNGVVTLDAWRNAQIPQATVRMVLPERKADLSAKPAPEPTVEPGSAAAQQKEAEAALTGPKPSAEPPAPAKAPAPPASSVLVGKTQEIRVPAGSKYQIRYEVVEADSMIPSHDPRTFAKDTRYPEGVQNRPYHSDKSEQAKVIRQGQDFEPLFLVSPQPSSGGTPIVAPDSNVVLSGNSRTMSLLRTRGTEAYERYRAALAEMAPALGLKAEDIAKVQNPVLVRRLVGTDTTPEFYRRFAKETNEGFKQALNTQAAAVSQGAAMKPETMEWIAGAVDSLGENATLRDFLRSGRDREIIRRFIQDGVFTDRDLNRFIDPKTTQLNEDGKRLVERAILGNAIPDPDLLAQAPASIVAKIERSLGALAKIKGRGEEWDLGKDLEDAVRTVVQVQATGVGAVRDLRRQGSLLEEAAPTTRADVLADALIRMKPNDFKAAIGRYSDDAQRDVRGQETLGFAKPEDPASAFRKAFGDVAAELLRVAEEKAPYEESGLPSGSKPRSASSSSERRTPSIQSLPIGPDTQAAARSSQTRSPELPLGSSTNRISAPSESTTPRNLSGSPIAPTSTPSLRQLVSSVNELRRLAVDNEPAVSGAIRDVVRDIPGVEFQRARVKGLKEIEEKVVRKRVDADRIVDYLGARVVADSPDGLQQAVDALSRRFRVAKREDRLSAPTDWGYRGVHLDVKAPDGFIFELQVVPKPIADYQAGQGHALYEKWRNVEEYTPEQLTEKNHDMARSNLGFQAAYDAWRGEGRVAEREAPYEPTREPEPEIPDYDLPPVSLAEAMDAGGGRGAARTASGLMMRILGGVRETRAAYNSIVESPAFERWFGKSKVVEEPVVNGRPTKGPKVLYHGTNNPGFDTIDQKKLDSSALYGKGFYMTDSPEVAGGGEGVKGRGYAQKGQVDAMSPESATAIVNEIRATDRWKRLIEGDDKYLADFEKMRAKSYMRVSEGNADGLGNILELRGQPWNFREEVDAALTKHLQQGGVYPLYAKIENPLDMDAKMSRVTASALADAVIKTRNNDGKGEDSVGRQMVLNKLNSLYERLPLATGGQVYDALASTFDMPYMNDAVRAAGYDGIKYAGGGITRGRKHTVWVAFDPEQVKSAIGNRGTFDPDQPSMVAEGEASYDTARPPFFSALAKAIDAKMPERASAEQILAITKTPGVKPEEVKWTGLDDFLASKPTHTKAEVVEFLQQNAVTIGEVQKGALTSETQAEIRALEGQISAANKAESEWRRTAGNALADEGIVKLDWENILLGPKTSAGAILRDKGTAEKWITTPTGEEARQVKVPRATMRAVQSLWDAQAEAARLRSRRHLLENPDEHRTAVQESLDQLTRERDAHDRWDAEGRSELAELNGHIDELAGELNRLEEQPGASKFQKYTLPGGENYRELLLTLPRRDQPTFDPAKVEIKRNLRSQTQGGTEIWYDGKRLANYGDDPQLQPGLNERGEVVYKQRPDDYWMGVAKDLFEKGDSRNSIKSLSGAYRSNHWDEPNVLAHARFNDRIDRDGKKVLFIEELQSDWHQEGRRRGYHDTQVAHRDELIQKIQEIERRQSDLYGEMTRRGPRLEAAEAEFSRLTEERAALKDELNNLPKSLLGVPDAPFKKTWHELAFKRMLRWAAEHGYDRVAWTTGEQQAERYDLSSQVDSITWHRTKDGKYEIAAWPIEGGRRSDAVLSEEGVTPERIADLVGKDIADKIVASTENGGTLRGVDLKVGGEGMKGFYDQILPAFAAKYGKKWGAKVETRSLGKPPRSVEEIDREIDRAQHADDTARQSALYLERDAARFPEKANTAHSMDITPEMRRSVLIEGQPLFEKGTPYGDSPVMARDGATTADRASAQMALFDLEQMSRRPVEGVRTFTEREQPKKADKPAPRGEDAGAGVRTTSRLLDEFKAKGFIDFRGQKLRPGRELEDLAEIAQVARDPRYETFRYFYTKGNEIVGSEAFSSRVPGSTMYLEGMERRTGIMRDAESEVEINRRRTQHVKGLAAARRRMERLGADGYYIMHNHPSGRPEASRNDVAVTEYLADAMPGLKGHVIINSGQYGVIEVSKERRLRPKIGFEETGQWVATTRVEDLPSARGVKDPLLGSLGAKKIEAPEDLALIGRTLKTPDNYVTLVHRDSGGNVRAVQEMPVALFNRTTEASDFIRGQQRAFGASDTFAVLKPTWNTLEQSRNLVKDGVLQDAIAHGATASESAWNYLASKGKIPIRGDIEPPARDTRTVRVQEESSYGDFERLKPETRKKLVDFGREVLKDNKTDFASWSKAMREKLGEKSAGTLPGAWAALMQETARTQAKPAARPTEGKGGKPPEPPKDIPRSAGPIDPPPGLTDPQLKLGLHKDVVDAAMDLFKAGKIERDRTMLISDQILDAIRDGTLRIEDMAKVLDSRGMTFSDFGAQMFRPAITDAARRLGALGQLQRRLNELETELTGAAPGRPGGKPGEPDPDKLKTIGDILDAARAIDPAREAKIRNQTLAAALAYWRRADNVRRGLLVTQLATSVRNFTSQVGRLGLDVMDQGLQGGLQRAFGKEVTQHPADSMKAMMDVFRVSPAEAKRRVDALLEGLPREEERLFSNYASDLNRVAKKQGADKTIDAGLRGAEKAVEVLNTFNRFQEYAVRRAVFQAELGARLRRRGIDLEAALKDPTVRREIPVADIRAAIERSLEITFASNPAYGSAGYHFIKWINKTPGATFLIPFPRFMMNALKFYLEFSPAGFLKFLSEAERQKFRQGDMKTMSRGLLGIGLLSSAYLIRSMQDDDTKWNEVRLPGMERTIDVRPLNPFASYLFVADVLRRYANGNLYGGGLATEAVKNILGVNVRGGTGLQAMDQLVDGLRDIGDARALTKYLQGAGGHLVAGLLTPLQQLTDVYAEFDPEAQVLRQTREQPFAGPIKQRFPSTMVEALGGELPSEKASPTSGETPRRESPGIRQFTGLTLGKAKNDFEKELDRLQIPYREILPSQRDPRLDNMLAAKMGPMAEEEGSRLVNSTRFQNLGEIGRRLELKAYLQRLRKKAKAQAMTDKEYRDVAREVKAGVSKERLKEMAREEKAGLR